MRWPRITSDASPSEPGSDQVKIADQRERAKRRDRLGAVRREQRDRHGSGAICK